MSPDLAEDSFKKSFSKSRGKKFKWNTLKFAWQYVRLKECSVFFTKILNMILEVKNGKNECSDVIMMRYL